MLRDQASVQSMHGARAIRAYFRSRRLASTHAPAPVRAPWHVTLPVVRLPASVIPTQALSLRLTEDAPEDASLALPRRLADRLVVDHQGRVAAIGPCGEVGMELRFLEASRPGAGARGGRSVVAEGSVAHAVCGRRLRLLDHWLNEDGSPMARMEVIADDGLGTARAERLQDEVERARELLEAGVARGAFTLRDTSSLGTEVECDPRSHPLWRPDPRPPLHMKTLSFWLAARLPLAPGLRGKLAQCTCPLQRMRDTVDIMRMLLQEAAIGPQPHPRRFAHRFQLVPAPPPLSATAPFLVDEAAPPPATEAEPAPRG